jgi:putative DNA primase/helicase
MTPRARVLNLNLIARIVAEAPVVELGVVETEIPAEKPKRTRKRRIFDSGEGEKVGKTRDKNEGGAPPPRDTVLGSAVPPERVPPETIEACLLEPLNDTGNGKRQLLNFGAEMLHVRAVGWHYWAVTHWEKEGADEAIERFAQLTAARIALEADLLTASKRETKAIEEGEAAAAVAKADLHKRKTVRRKFAVSSGNGGKIENMIKRALPHKTKAPADLDVDPLAFNVLNGTLRFYAEPDDECPDPDVVRLKWKVRLDPHNRDDLISKCAPVEYEVHATCPQWDAFMERFQPQQRVRDFLRIYYGYALTGLTGAQKLLFNWGEGANGKSTFIECLCRRMGPYAQTLNPESFTGANQRRGDQATPDLADLVGARLLRVSELPERSPLQDNLIKAVTGGEPMKARHLHMPFFLLRPVFKASLSGNSKPNITDVSHGMWRRLMLVPWTVTIEEVDQKELETMQAMFEKERAGILNWLVTGALEYLDCRKLYPPEEVIEATAEHRGDSDHIGQFIEACLLWEEHRTIGAGKLYEFYYGWCYDSGIKPWQQTAFGTAMPKHKIDGHVIAKRVMGDDRTIKYLDLNTRDSAVPRAPPERIRGT